MRGFRKSYACEILSARDARPAYDRSRFAVGRMALWITQSVDFIGVEWCTTAPPTWNQMRAWLLSMAALREAA